MGLVYNPQGPPSSDPFPPTGSYFLVPLEPLKNHAIRERVSLSTHTLIEGQFTFNLHASQPPNPTNDYHLPTVTRIVSPPVSTVNTPIVKVRLCTVQGARKREAYHVWDTFIFIWEIGMRQLVVELVCLCEILKEFIGISHRKKIKSVKTSELPLTVANLAFLVLSLQSV